MPCRLGLKILSRKASLFLRPGALPSAGFQIYFSMKFLGSGLPDTLATFCGIAALLRLLEPTGLTVSIFICSKVGMSLEMLATSDVGTGLICEPTGLTVSIFICSKVGVSGEVL